jgi:glyoxylase-like metal-dependent hydrolase (beta-lactamase superfamily II)/8-oxo-dGTP pyrophosphatase MutT (NUDIX family)
MAVGVQARVVTEPRPASTVVLFRQNPDGIEVLLTHRPATMAFAGDMHVFPGGAVDPADHELGGSLAHEVAALRELFEEAGVLLAEPRDEIPPATDAIVAGRAALLHRTATLPEIAERLDVVLQFDRLAPLSRWVTPPFIARRFDTHFFAAELPIDARVSFVGNEVAAHRWVTPRAALEARAAGEIGLWVPTSTTLQQLEHVRSMVDIRTRLAPGEPQPIRLEGAATDIVRVVLPSAGGVDGQEVNGYVIGRRDLVVVDPGDPSDAAADAFLAIATGREAKIVGIVLTSIEPDHAAGAEALAGRISVPVFAGTGASRWLPNEVAELRDGDVIPVGDVSLTTLASPGPRPEALAFVAADSGLVLVGDLVGPGASRAIVGPPDPAAWIASLDRVVALAPRTLLPGHGDPPADHSALVDRRRAQLRLVHAE